MKSVQGQLLVASPRLADPNFYHSIVLMIQHDEGGALGLILNRPLDITVRQALAESIEVDCHVEGVLHQGGPCEGPLTVVHGESAASQVKVLPDVHFTAERGQIESLLSFGGEKLKCFVNHSGWGPGQLEEELEGGSWLVVPATADRVFSGDRRQWSRLVAEATLTAWIDPQRIPSDPSLN
jgi:putative transcriptional regulator